MWPQKMWMVKKSSTTNVIVKAQEYIQILGIVIALGMINNLRIMVVLRMATG